MRPTTLAPPAPSNAPPLVPVERLTAPREHFRCDRLHGTLAAEVCLERQRTARTPVSLNHSVAHLPPSLQMCRACPVGEAIAGRFPKQAPRATRRQRPTSGIVVGRMREMECPPAGEALEDEDEDDDATAG